MAAAVRIGTCSWADESLSKYFYPSQVKGAEERLRYYTDRFDTVEANSTYYRLPDREMVQKWADRTPDGFLMHVKAFGVMTRHPVKIEQLPTDLRDEAPQDERGRVDRPPREFRGEIFRRFHDALEPLRETGKLGAILMQFPPYVVPRPAAFGYLEWAEPLQELAGKTESVYAMFNNNGRSTVDGETIAQAPVNAQMLKGLLQEAQIPV